MIDKTADRKSSDRRDRDRRAKNVPVKVDRRKAVGRRTDGDRRLKRP